MKWSSMTTQPQQRSDGTPTEIEDTELALLQHLSVLSKWLTELEAGA
jgi:hypothetical protein